MAVKATGNRSVILLTLTFILSIGIIMLTLLYFAKLKDDINCSQETLAWDPTLVTVNDLQQLLSQRSEQWQKAFDSTILCAVNQAMVKPSHSLADGDEVAFFPPVTGG